MTRRFLSLLCALALCLGLTPATALAAGEDAPDTLYVGNQSVRNGDNTTYWVTNGSGGLESSDANANWDVKYEPATATLTLNGATIDGGEFNTTSYGAGIYARCSSNQSVTLTIELIGTNAITGTYGIYVDAQQGENVGANASLKIAGDGSLEASGSSYGIVVKSGTGNASLTINDASVKANTTSTSSYFAGVYVMSSSNAIGSPELSLAVNGGSLTASGGTSSDGIQFYVGDPNATNAITSLTVSENAIVDARTGGIKATRVSTVLPTPTPTGEKSSGIVFDGTEGTVYGDVTLDESLTIAQGETLTIPEGATLNTNGNLTNNGTIVNTGGTLNGEPGGTIVSVSVPAITTESLPEGTAGQPYTATLEATGNNITWSVTEGTLPEGLTLNESTGEITGTPATEGQFPVTVTATNSVDSASKEYMLNIKPATVSVSGLKLDKDSLTLQENGSGTLTATVEPADATNKAVTWASSDKNIVTVDDDGTVTAVSAGRATITATAADGSGISASCEVTVTHGDMVQTPKKDATCTADGTEGCWTCGICGKHFKDEGGTVPTIPEENVIPKTGHAWGETAYAWSDDGKTCTATRTCDNDSSHTESAEATVTFEQSKDPTCTDPGETTYTATFDNDWAQTQTKTVADIASSGHSWGDPVWSWSDDGKTATATFTCRSDESHQAVENATMTSTVKTPATCTETGVTTYAATVKFDGETYTETKDVADIPTISHKLTKMAVKDATCTDPGNIEYWVCSVCKKVFADADGKKEITLESTVIPATGHSYGDDGHCTVCGAVESDFVPEIIAGANATWHKGSGKDLSFTSNAAYGDFLKVLIDGEELDASNYAMGPGSTAVTLKASYLETLSVGKHTLGIVSDTGTAETEFTVAADGQAADDEAADDGGEESLVKTGDGSMLPITVLSVIAAVAAAAGAFSLRRIRL